MAKCEMCEYMFLSMKKFKTMFFCWDFCVFKSCRNHATIDSEG
jgi:hypothetical protein